MVGRDKEHCGSRVRSDRVLASSSPRKGFLDPGVGAKGLADSEEVICEIQASNLVLELIV
jgi:hypothetical protein